MLDLRQGVKLSYFDLEQPVPDGRMVQDAGRAEEVGISESFCFTSTTTQCASTIVLALLF